MKKLEGCKLVTDGIYWGGNLEQLSDFIKKGKVKPNTLKFFAGYLGFKPEELDKDLKSTWLQHLGTKELILSSNPEDMWGNTLKKMGNSYHILANFPEDPCLN